MPPLHGFSDNSFRTRDDVVHAAGALLKPLAKYFSPGKARIRVPYATGTHFDETAAQLEGFARPLWAIGSLLMGDTILDDGLIQHWVEGFEAGTDPNNPEYWGPINDYDQRMVEAEMISFALLASPKDRLWKRFGESTRSNIIRWLSGFHGRKVHVSNWLWFRVFANLALLKVCEVDTPDVRRSLGDDLHKLDKMYMTDGWSCDGIWRSPDLEEVEWMNFRETGKANTIMSSRNACYYSGSFAIQFSQLLYIRFAPDLDPERTERYRQQAREFGAGFWRYFDSDGAAIPFGRSLSYRFACGGFFAALALAKVDDMPEPLATTGDVKGFLLRHLRWWSKNSEYIFRTDGTLDFGWIYPNMYMTEDYNSPQSAYWALKSLVVLGLTADDPFWNEPEALYPDTTNDSGVKCLPGPRHILCNRSEGNHHFLLSTAQFIGAPFKAAMAKYSKFAYSSNFAFSVPTGSLGLGQVAPDSVLALSRDGMETWAVKYKCDEPRFGKAVVCGTRPEVLPAATVRWYPWADRCLAIDTTVIPPSARWPDWHVRIHRLHALQDIGRLFTAEGGFALNGRQRQNTHVLPRRQLDELVDKAIGKAEGVVTDDASVLILSDSGASGVTTVKLEAGRTTVTAFKPEPNTNIMVQRSLIPLIENNIPEMPAGSEIVMVAKVFAVAPDSNVQRGQRHVRQSLERRWLDRPHISLEKSMAHTGTDYVRLMFE